VTTVLTATAGPTEVRLRVTSDAPAAARIEVRRAMTGTWALVRAWPGFDGAWVHTDIDVLFGTPLDYEAAIYDTAGTLLETSPPVRGVVVEHPGALLRDALVPAHRTPLRIVGQQAGDTSSDVRRELLRPLGRTAPLAITDVRQQATGTTTALTLTRSEADRLHGLLATGNILLFTAPAGFGITAPFYLSAGPLSKQRPSAALHDARLWTFDWVEVDGPGVLAPTPATTWGDLLARGTRWADIRRTPWVDVLYPPDAPVLLRSGG
jgi:hypothetical protein